MLNNSIIVGQTTVHFLWCTTWLNNFSSISMVAGANTKNINIGFVHHKHMRKINKSTRKQFHFHIKYLLFVRQQTRRKKSFHCDKIWINKGEMKSLFMRITIEIEIMTGLLFWFISFYVDIYSLNNTEETFNLSIFYSFCVSLFTTVDWISKCCHWIDIFSRCRKVIYRSRWKIKSIIF